MVTTLTVITYLPGRDCLSNTDETSIVETHIHSCVYYKLTNTIMEIIHDITILIILGITLQYIERLIVNQER